jgi:hypothetical protein
VNSIGWLRATPVTLLLGYVDVTVGFPEALLPVSLFLQPIAAMSNRAGKNLKRFIDFNYY